nr:phage tail protein [uncultured Acetatifactor sp.]
MSGKSQNVVITRAARQKLVHARAGASALPRIVGMAFGNGGVDVDGNIIAPTENQDALANELLRKPVDGYSFPNNITCRYECTLAEEELAGEEISEVGLYDEDGDIVAIKAFKRKGKDDDVAQTYILDDIF